MKFLQIIKNYFPDIDKDQLGSIKINQYILLPLKKHAILDNNYNKILSWPPNIFIILYAILEYTDKYRLIVSPQHKFTWNQSDKNDILILRKEWAILIKNFVLKLGHTSRLTNNSKYKNIENNLNIVFNQITLNSSIYDLFDNDKFTKSVFLLFISIDELFESKNHMQFTNCSELETVLNLRALLNDVNDNLSDCESKYGSIAYKSNVPQSGLTINNLTQHLTLVKPTVKPKAVITKLEKSKHSKKNYNILLLPWPLKVEDNYFSQTTSPSNFEMDEYFGFFDYKPTYPFDTKKFLIVIHNALQRIGTLDLIVFPECTMSEKQFDDLKTLLFQLFRSNAPILLSGIFSNEGNNPKNAAKLAFIDESKQYKSFEQKKHHRWFLDKNQLRNYNLSGVLDPNKKWWEHIEVGRRNLLTLHTVDGIKLCPLICEDLARQEPVAQAVRSIGPNLVVSLLLDGPQLRERWPGKYAAVLSDDPGSSVLSVTALGMTMRSTGSGHAPSRGVALWSEPGQPAETLHLDDNASGIIIELEMKDEKMWSIDGRNKEKPVLRKIIHTSVNVDGVNDTIGSLQTKIKVLVK